mgnify:CR=1 FL=1
MSIRFIVLVDDNYHFMEEEARYCLGEFSSEAEALAAARKVVDEFLFQHYAPGVTADTLWESYMAFGEDPWIENHDFSAWEYAKDRCREVCGSG